FVSKGLLSRIEEMQAYHLPFSFLRVSVLTSPWSERCNLILTLPILDNDSRPPFTRNPAWGYVNESNQPWPLKRGNPRPRRKNAWYVLSTRCSTSCSTCEYTLPSAGSASLQAGNCADCMEKDTQVRHNFQASRRSLRASLYNWRHTSSVEIRTSRCLRFGHNRYLYVLLIFDIWLDDRQRRTPDGGHEIAVRPQRRQPWFQGAKFLPQAVRGNALEVLNQPMDTQLRVYFYQHVYVVGHDFQSHDFGTI